jgi:hypothetical protein
MKADVSKTKTQHDATHAHTSEVSTALSSLMSSTRSTTPKARSLTSAPKPLVRSFGGFNDATRRDFTDLFFLFLYLLPFPSNLSPLSPSSA